MANQLQGRRDLIIAVCTFLALFIFRRHVFVGWQLTKVYLNWSRTESYVRVTDWRDELDTTFEAYPINQSTAFLPQVE